MSRILIHYFTGTGNTARAVTQIKSELEKDGRRVDVRRIARGADGSGGPPASHIFAFPVLAFSAPALVKKYLRRLPRTNGERAAVLAVNGGEMRRGRLIEGSSGQALEQAESILHRKGYDVFLTRSVSFPANFTQIVDPPAGAAAAVILDLGHAAVEKFVEAHRAGKKNLVRIGLVPRLLTAVPALLFGTLGRRALGKMYLADERCSACGLCAKACPAGAIRLHRGQPVWKSSCEDCNRCINICPERSIQFSVPLILLHLALHAGLFSAGLAAVLAGAPLLVPASPAGLAVIEIGAAVALAALVFWLQFVPLDALLRLLLRWKPLRRLFSLSWTRRYRRYTAPGFKPLRPIG